METKNSFILFTESWSGLSYLDDHQLASVIRALFSMHGASCPMPELDTMSQMALGFILPRIEENRKKYEAKLEQKRINGSKGGRPPKPKNPEAPLASPTSQENDTPAMETEQNLEEPKKPTAFLGSPKNHDTDSETVYVNTTYSDHTPLPPQGGTDAAASDKREHCEPHTDTDTFAAQAVLAPEQPARKRQTRRDRKDEPPLRPEDWQAWYAMYPRHEARQAGILAWNAAVRSGVLPDLGVLLDALGWQVTANGWTPDRKQYTPLPATYLNARRWQDERPPVQVFSGAQQQAPQRSYPKADEMSYVVEHNRRVAAQVLAEFEAEQNARQEQENGNSDTETGSGTQAFVLAGHGCELQQDF